MPDETRKPDPAKITSAWTSGVNRMRPIHQEAQRSLGFLFGEHSMIFDRVTGRVYKAYDDPDEVRLRIPLIKPLWRREYAKVIKNPPVGECRPMSGEQSDRDAAEANQFVLDAEMERIQWPTLWRRLGLWTTSIGAGYLHPSWVQGDNPGNVDVQVLPFTEVVMDPNAKYTSEEALWAIHGQVLDRDTARERFGEEIIGEKSKDPVATQNDAMVSFQQLEPGGILTPKTSGVRVLRYWVLPCKTYPEGGVWTVVDGKLLDEEPWSVKKYPYKLYKGPAKDKKLVLPFVEFNHIQLPGRFTGQATLPDLWSMQKDYDESRSRQWDARAIMASPIVLAPKNSLETDRIRPVGGQVVEYRLQGGGNKPEPMNLATVPNFLFQTQDIAEQEMATVMLLSEASQGVTKSGSPTSSLLAAQATDDSAFAPVIQGLEASAARYFRMHMQMVQQKWTEERLVSMRPNEGEGYIARKVKNTDLSGNVDVRVVPGSAMPRSKAAIAEEIRYWESRGALTDIDYILSNSHLPQVTGLLSTNQPAVQKAKRENARFAALLEQFNPPVLPDGTPDPEAILEMVPVVEGWNEHEVEIKEHNKFRQTVDFENLPNWVKEQLAAHVEDHEAQLEQKLMKQMQEQQMLAMGQGGGAVGAAPQGAPSPAPMQADPLAGQLPEMS